MPNNKPAWSPEDDAALKDAVAEYGTDWPSVSAQVSDLTGRPRTLEACRYRYLRGQQTFGWPKIPPEKVRGRQPGRWPADLDAELLELVRRGKTHLEIARILKRTRAAVTGRLVALNVAHPLAAVKAGYQPGPDETPQAAWDRAVKATTQGVAKHKAQRFASVTIPTTGPIGLSVVSDQHIRETGPIQLARMQADAQLIAATPGLFAVLGGDGVDNHIKHHAAMVHGGSAPSHEWQLFEHYLGFFGSKIVAAISGNHDDWTSDLSGVDFLHRLHHERRVFFAPDEVVLDVEVGAQKYRMKVRHQYRFNSAFNQTHSVKRMWEMGEDPFDIGVVCHHHTPALEPFWKHGLVRWAARPGSYQLTSGYGRRYGHSQPVPTCPTFILWPGERRIVGFVDVRDAADYLTWAREKAA